MSGAKNDSLNEISRRILLRLGGMTAVGMHLSAAHGEARRTHASGVVGMRFAPRTPRIGMIGTGGKSTSLLENLLVADVEVPALCDVVREKAEHAQSLVVKAGHKSPNSTPQADHAFESLLLKDDLDLVIIATPWSWHVEMAVATMKHGKHAAMEVPAATTIDDCWKLVNTSEEARRHCIMLENCCYGFNEMLILRMTNRGSSSISSTARPPTYMIFVRNYSPTGARACGVVLFTSSAMPICTRRTAWDPWRIIWVYKGETGSTT